MKLLYRELIYSETNSEPVSNRMPECLKTPLLLPQQQLGNKALKIAGDLLGISEIRDCKSAAKYVTEKLKMALSKACDSSIAEMLEIMPGNEEQKDKLKNTLNELFMDPNTGNVKKVKTCPCTCP